ncbi:MAG: guanylate kinase, partial [Muribaculaceae bacterium]|nr:guanylate kinase [Muribaculaceae bacterium]
MEGKLIIICAPSGSGKSTIIGRIIDDPALRLAFSVSATTRPRRGSEVDGVDYYYLTEDEFKRRIAADEFAEYQEVYPGRFYGTLKSEIARINAQGRNVVLDIDVLGGINVKT